METVLSLFVGYWGTEWRNRKFEIYGGDDTLVTEDNIGHWNQSMFKDIIYPILNDFVIGNYGVRMKFQALPNTAVVYIVRLLKPEII